MGLDLNAPDAKGSSPIHIAAECNQLAVVLKLIDLGATKDSQDGNGKTPLDLAPKYNKQLVAALS